MKNVYKKNKNLRNFSREDRNLVLREEPKYVDAIWIWDDINGKNMKEILRG